ncbi:collagen-like protein [Fictibacillus phosphorivorans]|uniref:collagen-like protein n=1 Tax=Fictibacillus phosphorivorans TaxID=1221500 RepID=UPI000AEEDA15|nr:collagen-like protein [Fictibacillus phosphorivorans]
MSNRSFPFFPGQGGQGGGQGFGPPGGGPPGGPPGGGGGMAPTSAPPSFTPSQSQGYSMQGGGPGQVGVYAVDPGAIRPCLYQYVYIWPTWGPGFWAWLTFAGRRSIAGYRWIGYRWVYFGMDTRRISSFYCY